MNKLKEINGKFYQEAEVVMLATDNKTSVINLENDDELLHINQYVPKLEYGNQHLYFLSNEEIKERDYYYNDLFNMVDQLIKGGLVTDDLIQTLNKNKHNRKIIATTDTSLSQTSRKEIPQPSKEFIQVYIKTYNENKPITKVLVEYEFGYFTNNTDDNIQTKLKINSNNEITIKKIKNSYTREEVVELCKSAFITGTRENDIDYFEWERQNL